MTAAPDPILDDLFHACALEAFVQESRSVGGWPHSEAVKQRAYRLYEEEMAKKSGPGGGQVTP